VVVMNYASPEEIAVVLIRPVIFFSKMRRRGEVRMTGETAWARQVASLALKQHRHRRRHFCRPFLIGAVLPLRLESVKRRVAVQRGTPPPRWKVSTITPACRTGTHVVKVERPADRMDHEALEETVSRQLRLDPMERRKQTTTERLVRREPTDDGPVRGAVGIQMTATHKPAAG